MNKRTLLTLATFVAGSIAAATAGPLEDINAATKALSETESYSWTTIVKVPEGTRFSPGPTYGKVTKDGMIDVKLTFGDNTTHAIIKGEKAAITNQDGGWDSASEIENSEGPGRFRAGMVRNIQTPSKQAAEIAATVTEWKSEDGVLSGELTKEGATELMRFRRRGGNGGPEIFGAVGSAKFWIKDGVLQKYQYKVEGLMEFNNNDIDIDRDTTVEIKDIGSTKIEVPEAAKAKLS